MFNLQGQTALITGGTRGIGAAITRTLLRAGVRVIAIYHSDEQTAKALSEQCHADGGQLTTCRLDVSNHDDVQRFFSDLSEDVQILVNNCGVRQDGLLGMMSQQAWERVLAVNLSGAAYICKYAIRLMVAARYGRIINITSPAGRFGVAGQANYAASKAGLVALSRSLAREVATKGVTVNCVSPGFIRTDMLGDIGQHKLEELRQQVPMGRFGEPDEVAAAVLFLASMEASYISGAIVSVTGGI
jgi:3-oxoacyl-[acyl-carrier protein] reductase